MQKLPMILADVLKAIFVFITIGYDDLSRCGSVGRQLPSSRPGHVRLTIHSIFV